MVDAAKAGSLSRTALLLAVAVSALGSAALAGGSGTAPSAILPVDLGTLGGDSSEAVAINEIGQVVGFSTTVPGGSTHAFSWTSGGGMIDLGSLGGDSKAVAVNDAGQVAGWSTTASGVQHAFFWSQPTGMVDLGTLGGSSTAVGLDDAGMVVGNGTSAAGDRYGWYWTPATGMVQLGDLDGGTDTEVEALNGAGQAVGSSAGRAFLWSKPGGMIDLGAGINSRATAVSEIGQVGGTNRVAPLHPFDATTERPFLWTQTDGIVKVQGGQFRDPTQVTAVNSAGQLVGWWWRGLHLGTEPFLWTSDGGVSGLGSLGRGGGADAAADVNEAGQIVGQAGAPGNCFPSCLHAFVFTASAGMVDLDTPGGTSIARDVNDVGQVVGVSDPVPFPGQQTWHATLWSAPRLPVPPRGVSATAGDAQATVDFDASPAVGGSPVAYYTVKASPGGAGASGASSPITVDGLANGTSYTFTVTAFDGLDTSVPSAPSNAVVPAGPEREHPEPPAEAPRASVPDLTAPSGPRPPLPGR